MTAAQGIIIAVCGLVIGLAVYLFIRSLRKMAKGRCCEGCAGCSQADNCSSYDETEKGESGRGS